MGETGQDETGQDETGQETAAALGRAIAEGRQDPVELAEAALERIARHPGGAEVFARLSPERARAEAEAAHRRRAEGRPAGPLDGVPVSWKDNIDSAGIVTEAGTRLLAGRVPERDATVLARGSAAGLVCLGKTHLSELAFSGLGVNPMTATAPNAVMPGHAPGGSSSGAAASLALGLAAGAIGSDTGGSVRIPACWQGLVGLKTTPGLLPNDGVVPLAASLDTVGPLARSVEDAGPLLAALLGEPAAPLPDPATPAALEIPETVVLEGCEAPVLAAFEAAVDRIGQAGTRIARGPLPAIAEVFDVVARLSPIVTAEAWGHWGAAIEAQPGVMYPPIEARFRLGATVDPAADAEARAEMTRLGHAVSERIAAGALLAMPTVAILPPALAPLLTDEAHYSERNLMALRNTRLVNLLGLPAITLPLPEPATGLMLVGAVGEDRRLIAAGRALEPLLAT